MKVSLQPQPLRFQAMPSELRIIPGVPGEREETAPYEGEYTVTPSETETVLETQGKKMSDDVTVNAIPSDYVGAGVTRRSATDLTANGATVSAPSGYYEESASKSIQNATTQGAALTVNPSLEVDYNTGTITATNSASSSVLPIVSAGFADTDTSVPVTVSGNVATQLYTLEAATYTPTKSGPQTIAAGRFLTGDQTISAIPEQYYDMSGNMAWLGKDAECIDSAVYSVTDALKNTTFNTWTPSTTAATMVSAKSPKTFVADLANYEYYLVWECGVDMAYTGSPTLKAHFLFSRCYLVQQITKRPSTFAKIQAKDFDGNACTSLYTSNFLRYYGTTQGSVTYTWSTSYGLYFGASAATFSSSTSNTPTVTIKTPTLSARCSTTYFSTGNAALADKDNSEYWIRGKLYRVKKEGILRNIYNHVVDLINE